MVTEKDIKWLGENYPGLVVTSKGITGSVEIVATYNLETNRFLNLQSHTIDDVGGVRLSGSFKISIYERATKPFSNLPALKIEGIELIADRHINALDESACLCSPLAEDEYLTPEFNFQIFFERLVIPFLYGQLFYSREKSWPWMDYGHGSIGLLESYKRLANPKNTERCMRLLSRHPDWQTVKSILKQKSVIKGHTLCFCKLRNKIRNCHPEAWGGINKLQSDIVNQHLTIS